jgi:hypothetical protein
MTGASRALIQAHVAEVLEKVPNAQVIGLQADPAWTGPATLEVAGRKVSVAGCVSSLAVRAAIAEHSGDGPLVILTDLDVSELGAEVRAKLAKHRLVALNQWQAALSLFRATRLDPRLAGRHTLAEGLIELAPPGGYAPAGAGFLDLATVRRAVIARLFGADAVEGSLGTLLRSLDDQATVGTVERAPEEVRAEAMAGLHERLGSVVDLLAAAAARGTLSQLSALGLACRAVFSPLTAGEALPAAIRLEAFLGKDISSEAALVLADAAEATVTDRQDPRRRRAEDILKEVDALQFAWASSVLPAGFDARLRRFGTALERALAKGAPGPKQLAELERAATEVRAHREAAGQPRRPVAVQMAVRLARRLAVGDTREADGFVDAVESYVADGGFTDWARATLIEGDTDEALVAGYARLARLTAESRRVEDERFAKLLANWAPAAATTERAVLIEDLLDVIVRPLVAGGAKVLLVVLDGMSHVVFRALLADLAARGWAELGQGDGGRRPAVIAAFPTVTEVCRTSLLAGRLLAGSQVDEKLQFPLALPGARLFHKNDLLAGAGAALPAAVLEALDQASGADVVGVVINAIDDHLLKGDQVRVDWTADTVSPLSWVLQEGAGRIVVLTADHGHVPETGTTARVGDAGERWRTLEAGPVRDDEVELTGPRVLLGAGHVVAPWVDDVRYSASKRQGYHGGASPREVVVPLAVLTNGMPPPQGWMDVPTVRPAWWQAAAESNEATAVAPRSPQGPPVPPVLPAKKAGATPSLFDQSEPDTTDWITHLQSTALYRAQRERFSRRVPPDDRVRAALVALAARGGTLPVGALAEAVGTSALRIGGLMAGLGDLLNVDGYLVVRTEAATGAAVLDLSLLRAQFGLDTP